MDHGWNSSFHHLSWNKKSGGKSSWNKVSFISLGWTLRCVIPTGIYPCYFQSCFPCRRRTLTNSWVLTWLVMWCKWVFMRSDGSLECDPCFTEPGTTRRPSCPHRSECWHKLKLMLYHFLLLDSRELWDRRKPEMWEEVLVHSATSSTMNRSELSMGQNISITNW